MKNIETRGITLISLVITIILMLILAGVVISLTIGENGLFKTSKYAVQKNSEAEAKENGRYDTDLIEQQVSKVAEENGYHSQHIKNVTFKKISKSSSWRIESVEDLDKH